MPHIACVAFEYLKFEGTLQFDGVELDLVDFLLGQKYFMSH